MEVFIRNLPEQTSEKGLKNFFRPHMDALSIKTFYSQKIGKNATLTFLDKHEAENFLSKYGSRARAPNFTQLRMMGCPIYCSPSRKQPNKFVLRSLEKEARPESLPNQTIAAAAKRSSKNQRNSREFNSNSISCGIWAYEGADLVFVPQMSWHVAAKVKFGGRRLTLTMNKNHLDIPYTWINNITVGELSMTITCIFAPQFSEGPDENSIESITNMLQSLMQARQRRESRKRVSSLDEAHQRIASSCFVYRVDIFTPNFNEKMLSLRTPHELPPILFVSTFARSPSQNITVDYRQLREAFTSQRNTLSFPVMFQLQRLAQDGYLPPLTVLRLFQEIKLMEDRSGTPITVSAIRKLFIHIPYRGPEAAASIFQVHQLLKGLRDNENRSRQEEQYTESENVANIYRAMVTPAGVYLRGPEPETKNRVLRKYNDHLDYFLRVEFCDESGEQLRYDPRVSNEEIFYKRFKDVLSNGINIAGREYGFLGFPHSSLRSQSCWFMAPFDYKGDRLHYQQVISSLGDFSNIHSPAKCAARIGQAFSDTTDAISLGSVVVGKLPDVERNGRVFSDGVGTISESFLRQIWDALPNKRSAKPTALQIRFSGAKGMVSLDSRLKGHSMLLRPSMIKFPGYDNSDIELCGAAYKPLPMFLNRQTIKILEDLGVPDGFFLDLQADAVEQIRQGTLNNVNASKFLSAHAIGEVVRFPWFVKQLVSLNLSFHDDAFLRNVVELSALVELRQLKHRSRILVKNGATLYGIMDETGFLEEGEVFIIKDIRPGVSHVVTGERIVATRSPALHPGDAQLVRAVSVPKDSPLLKLSNCVCFSQKGKRDLPSMLSGGDLDGDLFNLIWDRSLTIDHTFEAADYPRQEPVDIGRSVTRDDMTDFFVKFMATDQLGRIATLHQILADQSDEGTLDHDCLTLARMHSTAVDYSKTNIPVNLSEMPKHSRLRPDFMAPGPHVNFEKKGSIEFKEEANTDEENHDDDIQEYRYYESEKVLGRLYRAIDEREIFRDIHGLGAEQQSSSRNRIYCYSNNYLMDSVLRYVMKCCKTLHWEHHQKWARGVRDWYDDCILNIMSTYAEHPLRPISENEVFIGQILGKTSKQSRKQRELSTTMKDRFNKDVAFIIGNIVKDGAQPSMEAVERSVACFKVSFETPKMRLGLGEQRRIHLVSFRYVAAAVCLKEIERCNGGKLKNF